MNHEQYFLIMLVIYKKVRGESILLLLLYNNKIDIVVAR